MSQCHQRKFYRGNSRLFKNEVLPSSRVYELARRSHSCNVASLFAAGESYTSGNCDLVEVSALVSAPSVTCLTNTDKLSLLSGALLRSIATLMPSLTKIDIQYASNTLGDNDIDYLVRNCSNLKSIHWDKFPHITNASLTSAALHLRGLIGVYISHCPGISDAGVTALARTAENPHTLHLTGLATLTDAAIQTVGTLCLLLKDLTVRNCNLITDSAFITLNMSKIINLDVSGYEAPLVRY